MRAPRGSERQQFVGGATTGFFVAVAASIALDRLDAPDAWQAVAILAQLAVSALVAWRLPPWRRYATAAMALPLAVCMVWLALTGLAVAFG